MRILSVISVKVFEKYGYNYLREIILRRADYQKYKISEKDFKNLHPNDFEDLFLLNIQEKLNHLPKTDKTSLHTAVNMWIRNLDAANYYFKEYYTIVPKPRAVVYRGRNDKRKLMRLNELYKFSDGTLTRDILKIEMEIEIRSTSDINAQDGDPLQDDVRLCLGDDLKKAQDHSQRQFPEHAPLSRKHAPSADDDLQPSEALHAPVLPASVSPGYSENSEPIEDDPQEADPKEEEELLVLAIPAPATPDPVSLSKEIEPFEEDEVATTPPSPTSYSITPLSHTRLLQFYTSSPRFEIGESSAAVAARQPGSTLAQGAQEDRAVQQAGIASLEREARYLHTRVATTDERSTYARDAWSIAMDMIKTLQYQRQDDGDRMTRTIGRVTKLELARELERRDGPPDTSSRTKGDVGLAHWTVGHDATYKMSWKTLMKMMTENYFARSEIKKLEIEMVPDESDKVEKYVGGLPDSIQGSVMESNPKMLQEAIEIARSLMNQKVRPYATRQTDNKRRMDNNSRDSNGQQPPSKWKNVARVYNVGSNEKREQQVHYEKDYPKLKNKNRGNQSGNSEARDRVYALGSREANPDANIVTVITEYLVNISKRHAFWSLNEDILKITVLTTYTPYPSRKIWRICAYTHQRPRRKHDQYGVSREDQYAVLEI
ncbi:hypothetical protein Tco_1446781 [Tanacetum coccineum]